MVVVLLPVPVMSAGKALSVRVLKGVACSFWQQAFALKVLSVSMLGAEGIWWLGVGDVSGGWFEVGCRGAGLFCVIC